MSINWIDYQERAVNILYNFDDYYDGVSKSNLDYYQENASCGRDEEEFILFLLQGVGMNYQEIIDEILIEEFQMTQDQANEVMQPYQDFK